MDGAIQFNGIVGILVMIATMVVFGMVVLIGLGMRLLWKKDEGARAKAKNFWFYAALVLLVFDFAAFSMLFLEKHQVWTKDEAVAFDNNMLMIWLPCHIVGYFLIAGGFYVLRSRKGEIDTFIDQLRERRRLT